MIKYYPLGDRITGDDLRALGLSNDDVFGPNRTVGLQGVGILGGHARQIMAKRETGPLLDAGPCRPPEYGEWYLADNKNVAYRCTNSETVPPKRFILKLVIVSTKTVIVEEPPYVPVLNRREFHAHSD